ncbi:ABC transporter ATPase [Polaribacter marinaquae]|uniref:ABC transporter ATPase n=1 Tax=Polaribacter marinaquae TaxID=1642819 RepID=A0ABZ2TPP3_9FLAO
MFVDFKEIPEDAKVWVYPSSRKFYANEIEPLEEKVKAFISTWKQDDDTFKASYKILYNRFIVITADNVTTPLKGADIDASVSFILGLQQEYEVELLDRMNVCFKQGEFVQYKDLKDFKKLLKNKALTGKSIVFDNLITTKEDFENFWKIPIEDSWYNRFLK